MLTFSRQVVHKTCDRYKGVHSPSLSRRQHSNHSQRCSHTGNLHLANSFPDRLNTTSPVEGAPALTRRISVVSPDVIKLGVVLEATVPVTSSLSQFITVVLKKPMGLVLAGEGLHSPWLSRSGLQQPELFAVLL